MHVLELPLPDCIIQLVQKEDHIYTPQFSPCDAWSYFFPIDSAKI
jgi:hypothetical protein